MFYFLPSFQISPSPITDDALSRSPFRILHFSLSFCFPRLVGAIFGTPADVVKARIMNQPTDKFGKGEDTHTLSYGRASSSSMLLLSALLSGLLYKNSFDCLRQTLNNEGFLGLYKGFLPCWLRMAPWSLTFWISFEQIRRICGAKSW